YSDAYHGKKTASGIKYDKNKMTCAHNDFPYGSMLKVTHLENKKSVTVKVIDRGPYIKGRIVDLSRAAAQKIGLIQDGVAQVKVELVDAKEADVLASKGDTKKTPDEYSTAPTRKTVEESIKKSNASGGANATKKTNKKKLAAKGKADAKQPKVVGKKKEELAAKGADAEMMLPMLTAQDAASTDLYQIALRKPKQEGYGVQVASFGDYENVLKKVADLQGKWFDNILIKTEKADGENVYKIVLGQFDTQDSATAYKKALKKKKIDGFVIALGEVE
ncbi:MAG: septal ring lytic transglycosylase RlpA family protein, partial [Bacteroidota bacterium]